MSEIEERLKNIEDRLDVLEKMIKTVTIPEAEDNEQLTNLRELLDLPSSLQKTMLAIQELEEATASEVAKNTGRDRTVENLYLNQLMRLGYLRKERKSRKIYFKVFKYY